MNLSQEHIAILEKGVHRVDPRCTYSVGQQCMWWPPVYYLKWSGLEGGVVGVVTILCLGEPFQPRMRPITSNALKVHVDRLVHYLRLAIGLWVKGRAHP